MDSFSLRYQILINTLEKLEKQYISSIPYDEIKYNYIPYEIKVFLNILSDIYETTKDMKNPKFIDIGCGIGTKVLIASNLFDAYGIDCNQNLIDISKIIGCKNTSCCDIFDYDFSQFDILFYYRPFYDDKIYETFENKIYTETKVGSIIIAACSNFSWSEKSDIQKLSGIAYRKITDPLP
jgi:hypothetical protein